MAYTISTHNGSQIAYDHNIRNRKVTDKEKHIDPNGINEIWLNEKIRDAYHRIFDLALEEYNQKQTRDDRKIKDYYNHIKQDAKKHVAYEMIVSIGNRENRPPKEIAKEIFKKFVEDWKIRNKNLELIGVYYHEDEQGVPHIHLDYIPLAIGYKRGLEIQTGLVKALGQMGFVKEGKLTAQIQWEKRENKVLEEMCVERGLEIEHPMVADRKHIETELYKTQKELEEKNRKAEQLEHEKYVLEQENALLREAHDITLTDFKRITEKCKIQQKNYEHNKEVIRVQKEVCDKNDRNPNMKMARDSEELRFCRKILHDVSVLCAQLFKDEIVNNLEPERKTIVKALNHALACVGEKFLNIEFAKGKTKEEQYHERSR